MIDDEIAPARYPLMTRSFRNFSLRAGAVRHALVAYMTWPTITGDVCSDSEQACVRCPACRFPLTQLPGVLVKHPFAPSLDRISSHGGSTADNLRLVCIAVNLGMGQWGEENCLTAIVFLIALGSLL